MAQEVTEDVAKQAKSTTRIEGFLKSPANFIYSDLDKVQDQNANDEGDDTLTRPSRSQSVTHTKSTA